MFPCCFFQYFDQLNDHIAYDGPVQPLLITGDCGSGKSFLISRWLVYNFY